LWWSACCFSFVMGGPTGHGLPLCPRLCARLYDIRGDPDFCRFLGKLAKTGATASRDLACNAFRCMHMGLLYSVRRMSRPSLTSSPRLSSPRQCADPIILHQSPASPTTSSGPAARAPSPSSPCGASFLHSYLIHTAN
jgi:hypothetical protein